MRRRRRRVVRACSGSWAVYEQALGYKRVYGFAIVKDMPDCWGCGKGDQVYQMEGAGYVEKAPGPVKMYEEAP